MSVQSYEEVKELTRKLVAIPSIVRAPGGETNCARAIDSYYGNLPYFQKNPTQFKMFQTVDDSVVRHSTYAYVKGTKGNSNKTVILIGHIDTVGVDDYMKYKEYAFRTDELPAILKEKMHVSEEVLRDIDSGEYMFGRGTLDMKSGVAGHMFLIKYFSEHPEELCGNLIAIAECDEEDNSHGIISALYELEELKKREGFEYIACINADYTTDYYPGDPNRYVYLGSIGKLLPSFYAVGKETHVGQSFGGLDPNLLLAEITRNFSLNTELCDEAHGEVTVPPISLKQSDFKDGYTVQTALAAYSYFNFFTYSMSPIDVMQKTKEVAVRSFDNVVGYLNTEYQKYCAKLGVDYTPLPWKTRVYTWEELYAELAAEHGELFTAHIARFAANLNQAEPELDMRVFSVKVIEEAWTFLKDKSPAVVIFFGSVFSARIEVTGKNEKEAALKSALEHAVHTVQPDCKNPINIKMFYPYIADSSFMAISDDMASIESLLNNMPANKTKHHYPIDQIMQINVPVVNIGTQGKDGHKLTERVNMRYTFDNVPNMTYEVVKQLLK
ncbi:MAG: peptidase M20 [Clostridium sp. SCN 57-10]|nr:MAG: peptidase M20 [Clostridium sp. SCN 57-10]